MKASELECEGVNELKHPYLLIGHILVFLNDILKFLDFKRFKMALTNQNMPCV